MLRVLDITTMQRGLAAAGHDPGTIDGRYGPNTWTALANWLNALRDDDPVLDDLARELPQGEAFNVRELGATGIQSVLIPSVMADRLRQLSEVGVSAPPPLPFGTPSSRPIDLGPIPWPDDLPPSTTGLTTPPRTPSSTEFESLLATLAAGGAGPAAGQGDPPAALLSAFAPTTTRQRVVGGSSPVWQWLVGGTVLAVVVGGLWWVLRKR